MRYLSICSGIEAASVAWHPLGWKPLAFSEIEAFPRAVLAHHYPDVPLYGDFTKLRDEAFIADADVLVGGTPCQAFSVAGLRKSLDDDRGNLSLEFVRLADAIDDLRLRAGKQPAVIVWENVPGVLSVKDNAFGAFLAGLAGEDTALEPAGGRWTDAGVVDGPSRRIAWRVLDAQFFGLAQRRRRVFVVASARKGFDPAAVLLEWEGLRRDTPPSREARQVAPTIPSRSTAGGGLGTDFDLDGGVIRDWPADLAPTLNAHFGEKQGLEDQHIQGGVGSLYPPISQCLNAGGMGRQDAETETLIPTIGGVFDDVAHTLKAEGFDASEDGTGRGTPLVPVAFSSKDHGADAAVDLSPTLRSMGHDKSHANGGGQLAVAVPLQEVGKRTGVSTDDPRAGIGIGQDGDPMFTLQAGAQHGVAAEYYSHDYCHDRIYSELGISPALNCSQEHQVRQHMAVRRLTPIECERLQGFPDGWTNIPWRGKPEAPDGPRYKALGNSMAVPCMRWIGTRIAAFMETREAA